MKIILSIVGIICLIFFYNCIVLINGCADFTKDIITEVSDNEKIKQRFIWEAGGDIKAGNFAYQIYLENKELENENKKVEEYRKIHGVNRYEKLVEEKKEKERQSYLYNYNKECEGYFIPQLINKQISYKCDESTKYGLNIETDLSKNFRCLVKKYNSNFEECKIIFIEKEKEETDITPWIICNEKLDIKMLVSPSDLEIIIIVRKKNNTCDIYTKKSYTLALTIKYEYEFINNIVWKDDNSQYAFRYLPLATRAEFAKWIINSDYELIRSNGENIQTLLWLDS